MKRRRRRKKRRRSAEVRYIEVTLEFGLADHLEHHRLLDFYLRSPCC
jgi:hypothetical protein